MSHPDSPAHAIARDLISLVRHTGSFKKACAAYGISTDRAAYMLMKAELYNKVLASKYTEVTL